MRRMIIAITVLCLLAADLNAEVVVLKDGTKLVGKVEDQGDKIKVTTQDGEMTVKKDRIKQIYKDAKSLLQDAGAASTEAQKIIDGANKISDPKARNESLDKTIDIIQKKMAELLDAVDAFSGNDAKLISEQIAELNSKKKLANSLKVMKAEPPPPPPPPTVKDPPKKEPPKVDSKKVEIALEFYNLGLTAFNDKQYDKALEYFNKTASYNETPELLSRLGDTYEALKEEEQAYETYKSCLETLDKIESPTDEQEQLKDEVTKKIQKFKVFEDKLEAINKETVTKLMELGQECMTDKDYVLAEEVYALVLQIEEGNKEASELLEKARQLLAEEEKNAEKGSD
ncbi:MAG: hypothetical protein HY762_03400 [Planctomycetes bacterium]|nr:hypothetical protein [Planctomycetota bacterium]